MSHLAFAEEPSNIDTKKQITQFKSAIKLLKKYSIFPKWIHFGNSSGLLNNKKLGLSLTNLSRTGLALYGISSVKSDGLKPVLQHPIIGRVSMNLTVVDVSSVRNIKVGNKVIK